MKTIKLDGVTISEDKLREIIKKNPELVEEKGGRWKPRNGGEYYQIGNDGGVGIAQWYCDDLEADSAYDNWNWKTNNVFKTPELAFQKKAEIEALATINDYIDKEGLRGKIVEDENDIAVNYVIYRGLKQFDILRVQRTQNLEALLLLKSHEAAQQIVDKFENELVIVYGIKE